MTREASILLKVVTSLPYLLLQWRVLIILIYGGKYYRTSQFRQSVLAGAVIHDHLGSVRAAFALPCIGCFGFDIGEIFAAREALFQARQLGILIDILESDSKMAVTSINDTNPLANVGPMVEEIHNLFKALASSSYCFVLREANCVAHVLAKANNSLEDKIWLHVCSSFDVFIFFYMI
ncbi:hypothetical protein Dsin_022413 [Dipteronia sinensis]|uniref:RNase H type-1 domain-containing protein n=1 Tax=Dipteronia sinensis TaxID=43782 RepID=A0AAE0DZS0_9ROSI|nr:hypothetical protein Dsin_022413 [Dipteronia sinensis]